MYVQGRYLYAATVVQDGQSRIRNEKPQRGKMEKRKRLEQVERDNALFFRLNERLIAELNLTQLQNKKRWYNVRRRLKNCACFKI